MSFPKRGNSFPGGSRHIRPPAKGEVPDGAEFIEQIAVALRRELGGTHSAVKIAAAWTGTHERTVKNWFAGRSGPSGSHLAALARHSDEVLRAFLLLAGRQELLVANRLAGVRDGLFEILFELDRLIEAECDLKRR